MNGHDSGMAVLATRAAVVACVVRFANAFDRRDWGALRECLSDRIFTDYSQSRGTEPGWETADAYVEARKVALRDLATLHVVTNHEVELEAGLATCRSAYQIYRVELAGEQRRLDTAGNYIHGLVEEHGVWRISRITQTVVVQSGDASIHGGFRQVAVAPRKLAK